MKYLILIFLIFISFCGNAQIDKVIPPKPNTPRLVNDLAHKLTPDQVQALEQKLVAYDDSTSNQIAVVTINSTGDYDIQDVALGILRKWGVGNTQKNNGIVVLAAIDDHKVWIATGYGLEGAVPDITAQAIIDNDILPNFREGNFYRGFDAGTSSIIKAAAGEYKAPEGYNERGRSSGPAHWKNHSGYHYPVFCFKYVWQRWRQRWRIYVTPRIQRFWRTGYFPRRLWRRWRWRIRRRWCRRRRLRWFWWRKRWRRWRRW